MRRADQRRAAVVALYQRDVTRRPIDELVGSDATAFTRELVEGVEADRAELDDLIARHAEGWSQPMLGYRVQALSGETRPSW